VDEQELSRLLEKLSQGIALTDAEMRKLAAASSTSAKAVQSLSDAAKKGFAELNKSAAGLASSLSKGDKSFTQFNGIVDAVSGALGKMASSIPIAGGALEGSIKLVAEGTKFVLDQIEQTSKAFNDLGTVGGLTAKGMSDVQKQFITSGLSLSGFTKAVTENAQTLARFRGLTSSGAEDFSKIVGGIVDSNVGLELRRVGLSAEQMGEATAGYLTLQTRLGGLQKKTNTELAQSAGEYAKELDILTRITGMSRKEAMNAQQRVMTEDRFLSTLLTMEREGGEAGRKNAEALRDATIQIGNFDDELARGLRDMSGGIVDTEAARKTLLTLGAESSNLVNRLKTGQISADEFVKGIQTLSKNRQQFVENQARINKSATDNFLSLNKVVALNSATLEDGRLIAKKVQDESVEGTDKLTDKTVTAQQSLEQMSRQIQQFGFKFMPAASTAVESFTTVLNKFLKEIGDATGIKVEGVSGKGTTGHTERDYSDFWDKQAAKYKGQPGEAAKALVGDEKTRALLDYIGRLEGPAGYESLFGHKGPKEGLKEMTIAEVMNMQRQISGKPGGKESSAAGRYQFMRKTLEGLIKNKVVSPTDKFDPATQDKMAIALMQESGPLFEGYRKGTLTPAQQEMFGDKLANIWAALPTRYGKSRYAGVGSNKELTTRRDFMAKLSSPISTGLTAPAGIPTLQAAEELRKKTPPSANTGAILTGPSTGYKATLHGTEAVIPMPGGRNIPVDMTGMNQAMQESSRAQIDLLASQNNQLDELINLMRRQASISEKILQQAS
jgi:hypothetical protein